MIKTVPIGTMAEALVIQAFMDKIRKQRYWDTEKGLPKGWKSIGSGCSRWAFLSPTGVVYKVGDHYSQTAELTNSEKHRNNVRLRDLGVAIPRTTGYTIRTDDAGSEIIVIAMEYVPYNDDHPFHCEDDSFGCKCEECLPDWEGCGCNDGNCPGDISRQITKITELSDLHDENVHWKDGFWYIIDIAG